MGPTIARTTGHNRAKRGQAFHMLRCRVSSSILSIGAKFRCSYKLSNRWPECDPLSDSWLQESPTNPKRADCEHDVHEAAWFWGLRQILFKSIYQC